MLDTLTRESFLPYLKQSFRVTPQIGEGFEAVLIEISEIGSEQAGERRRSFSIVLRGPSERPLDQQICRIEHPELGSLDLFLVPIGPDADGIRLEAVFN